MSTVKTVATNYTAEQVLAITSQYAAGDSLEAIASSVGKSVPSVRAKLSQLKVYVSKAKSDVKTSDKCEKANKETLANILREMLGDTLLNIEAASKAALLALINAIKSRDEKIQALINDMLGESEDA